MERFLKAIAIIGYFIIGFVQLFAIIDFFEDCLKFPGFLAVILAVFLAYVPVIGTTVGVLGAKFAWGWSYIGAILLFFWPILLFIVLYIFYSADEKLIDRNKPSIGVYLISIYCVILALMNFFSAIASEGIFLIILGCIYIISGVGLIKRKKWALRMVQALFILSVLLCILLFIRRVMTEDLFRVFIDGCVYFVGFILPTWFLFKKSTTNQFINKNHPDRKSVV